MPIQFKEEQGGKLITVHAIAAREWLGERHSVEKLEVK
jgi:hypothetical protein